MSFNRLDYDTCAYKQERLNQLFKRISIGYSYRL